MDLTIIIPTYNRNSNVVECVLALDHNEVDIIVIDDGSAQPVVVPSTSARVIRHDRHRGRCAAINTGLKAAAHDLVMIIDDDVYAAPDMVIRLVDEFGIHSNPKLAIIARVVWDPDVPLTLTMQWLEKAGRFPAPVVLWRPFVLEHGGFDENFANGLEDIDLQLRLKQHGLEVCTLESAVGFHNKVVKIRDLVEREFREGVSAVYLHSKFPEYLPQVDDTDALLRNQTQANDAEAAVDEISLLEQSESNTLPDGASDLFAHIRRHYFLRGVFEGLRDIGGIKQPRKNSQTLAIYHQASHLESIAEFDEARRLFRLVLHRPDEEYWAGAEYHLGCIETELGNERAAHSNFIDCIRRNPSHNKARRALNQSPKYREAAPNVFESIEPLGQVKVLFVLFGGLGDVINAFPIVAGLQEKFLSEIVWLTSPKYSALAASSSADSVREAEPAGIIPWDWVHSEGFSHVFFPEGRANSEEWEQSGLHLIDFMARKCGVQLERRQSWLEPGPDAFQEAEEFLQQHGLAKNAFLTASHMGSSSRHWPHSNLMRFAQEIDTPTIMLGSATDPEIPCTISCFGKPFEVIAALIRWSAFYIGPDSGISWIATTTETPMGIFMDPLRQNRLNAGFRSVLAGRKADIEEWNIYTGTQTVLEHVRSQVLVEEAWELAGRR